MTTTAGGEVGRSVVEYSREGSVGVARLNRPDVRNAIDDAMRTALIETVERVVADDDVCGLVLTGSGRAFCAGGDIAAMQERLASPIGRVGGNGWRRQRMTHAMVLGLHNLIKVTVAAVNGPAMGVGMDLALGCDFIIAADNAVFAMSHLRRGLVPDGGGMYFLPRRVGLPRAKELIFTGRQLTAIEALELGVVDRVVPADELQSQAVAWASELGQYSPTAVALTKSILNRSYELSPNELFALGAEAQAICYTTDEHRRSIASFLEKGTSPKS
jgi:enoyl-CoA hydratase/carnithine racemase